VAGEEPRRVEGVPQEIALFLDVDGTLLDLAPHPEAVEVPADLIDALAAAERRLDGALALVSGRPIARLDRLFAPLLLRASGVHGAEIRCAVGGAVRMAAERRMPRAAWSELVEILARFPGTFAEDKRASFAIHYPAASADAGELAAVLGRLAARFGDFELELTAGHRVFEIRLPGFDKGKAIESFMAKPPFLHRRPIFIADDAMDRAGFDTVLAYGGLAYSVGRTLPGLSGSFPAPSAVRDWLGRLGR
jgi:trehalose 6-phosphate phosphatase